MALTRLTQTMHDNVGELTPCSFTTLLTVPDGTGGTRPPTAGEILALELTVTDVTAGTVINALDAVPLLSAHGVYNATTGVLTLNLVAADNPIVHDTLASEQHKALVHLPTLLWVEIYFVVQNQNRIP